MPPQRRKARWTSSRRRRTAKLATNFINRSNCERSRVIVGDGGLRMKTLALATLTICLAFAATAGAKALLADPINKKCPLTDKDVNPTKTTEYEKQTIGFCCDDCKGKFESDPKKYIGKVKEFKKKKSSVEDICCCAADTINKKCPIAGKDVNKEKTSDYEGQTIGFCCGNCKEKFDKDPAKYIDKVKEFKKKKAS